MPFPVAIWGGGVRQWGVRRSGHLGGHLSPARVRACVRVAHGPECVQHVSRECAPRHTPTTQSGRYRTTRRECSAKTKDRNLQGVARWGGSRQDAPISQLPHESAQLFDAFLCGCGAPESACREPGGQSPLDHCLCVRSIRRSRPPFLAKTGRKTKDRSVCLGGACMHAVRALQRTSDCRQ